MGEFLKEALFFLLGISLEAPKGKGWKASLFVWPFALAFIIVLFLLAGVFIVE